MGPFHMPWSTFTAFIVTAGSIVLAILWAVCDIRCGARRPARPGV